MWLLPALVLALAVEGTAQQTTCTLFFGVNGLAGGGLTKLNHPYDVFVHGDDDLYVTDRGGGRVLLFPGGTTPPTVVVSGVADATAATVHSDGRILVAQDASATVTIGPASGARTVVAGGNGKGNNDDQLNVPTGIALDADENLLVAESYGDRVTKWVIGGNGKGTEVYASAGFDQPKKVRFDPAGNLYVPDRVNRRVVKFAAGSTTADVVASATSEGPGLDQFDQIVDVAVDDQENLFIADRNNHRIVLWTKDATQGILVLGGTEGSGLSELNNPISIALDKSMASFYVADYLNHRVLKCANPLVTSTTSTSTLTSSSTSSSASSTSSTESTSSTSSTSATSTSSTSATSTTSSSSSATTTTSSSSSATTTASSSSSATTTASSSSSTTTSSSSSATTTTSSSSSATSTSTSSSSSSKSGTSTSSTSASTATSSSGTSTSSSGSSTSGTSTRSSSVTSSTTVSRSSSSSTGSARGSSTGSGTTLFFTTSSSASWSASSTTGSSSGLSTESSLGSTLPREAPPSSRPSSFMLSTSESPFSALPPWRSSSSSLTSVTSSSTTSTSSSTTSNTVELLLTTLASRIASTFEAEGGRAEELQDAARVLWRHLASKLSDAQAAASLELPGGVLVEVGRLRENLTMQSGLSVSLPDEVVAGYADAVLAVAVLPLPGEGSVRALQAMEVLRGNRTLDVSGLREPIVFSLPVNYSQQLACAYFDEENRAWSREGVATSQGADAGGRLECKTWHLSLFAALLQSALRTLECSNFGLFSAEAIARLGAAAWVLGPGAALCWCLLLLLMLFFAVAAGRDRRYAELWHPELLLIPSGVASSGQAAALACGGCALCGTLLQWCGESGAAKEAMDDILGNFFSQFAEVRALLESLCDAFEVDTAAARGGGRLAAICQRAMTHSMAVNARRVTGAHLFLSDDALAFLMGDEGLQEYLEGAYEIAAAEAEWVEQGTHRRGDFLRKLAVRDRDFGEGQAKRWVLLHHGVCQATVAHTHHYPLYSVAWVMASILVQCNPVTTALLLDLFTSCKERALLQAADTLGALALSCVFFEAGGMTKRRSAVGRSSVVACGEDEEYGDLGQELGAKAGRFLVVALGSYLLAGVPTLGLNGLLGRAALWKLDARDSKDWRQRLRARRLQRRLFWGLGGAYCCLCLFYILVFLANVQNDSEWALASVLALLQDFIFVPLIIAVVIPSLVALSLAGYGALGGDVRALRQQLRSRVVGRGSVALAVQEQHGAPDGTYLGSASI